MVLEILQHLLDQSVQFIRLLGQHKVLGVDHDSLEVGHVLVHVFGLVGLQVRVTQSHNHGRGGVNDVVEVLFFLIVDLASAIKGQSSKDMR